MYRLEVNLIGLPKRINEGMGAPWQVRHAEAQKWHKRLSGSMIVQRQPPPLFPLKQAKVTLIRYSSRCPDYDGLVQSFKCVVDALRKCLIIIDDSMAVIGKPDYQWIKCPPRQGKITVIVQEVAQNEKAA